MGKRRLDELVIWRVAELQVWNEAWSVLVNVATCKNKCNECAEENCLTKHLDGFFFKVRKEKFVRNKLKKTAQEKQNFLLGNAKLTSVIELSKKIERKHVLHLEYLLINFIVTMQQDSVQ